MTSLFVFCSFCLVLKLYSKSSSQRKSWYEARDYCRAIGGDLLSIHSAVDVQEERRYRVTAQNLTSLNYTVDPSKKILVILLRYSTFLFVKTVVKSYNQLQN